MTSLILFGIKYILRIPLRSSEEVLLIGDDAIHGEAAYSLDQHIPLLSRHDGERDSAGAEGSGEGFGLKDTVFGARNGGIEDGHKNGEASRVSHVAAAEV